MKSINIKLKSVGVLRFDSRKDELNLFIKYSENEDVRNINKTIRLTDDIRIFAYNVMREIKKEAKTRHGIVGDDPFGNYGNVFFEEKEEGESEEKLLAILSRIRDKARDFKRNKSSDNFINRLHEVNSLSYDVR